MANIPIVPIVLVGFPVLEQVNFAIRLVVPEGEDEEVQFLGGGISRQQIVQSTFDVFLDLVYQALLLDPDGFVGDVPRPISLLHNAMRGDDGIYMPFLWGGGVTAPWFPLPHIWDHIRHGVDVVAAHILPGPPDIPVEDQGENLEEDGAAGAEAEDLVEEEEDAEEDVDEENAQDAEQEQEQAEDDDAEDVGHDDVEEAGEEDAGEPLEDADEDAEEQEEEDVEWENAEYAEQQDVGEEDAGEPLEYDPDATESSSSSG
ncbi:unnamed protein product [Linum trigynum]|uniref:Uncharacterized protein n=1 Tax=Linum trigynum TaxID=586398 RepID=A0AAV2F5B6_9ROSI